MILDQDDKLVIGKGVRLNPYKPREIIKREYMTENELRNSVYGDVILDAESYINYFTVGFKHVASGKYINLSGGFNPFFLSWILFSFRTVGFNSLTFDLPLLWASYANRHPEYLKAVTNALIFSGKRAKDIAKEFNFKIYKLPERQHIDLINVCPLKGSLKLYSARLHCKRIQDLPFPDDQELSPNEIEIVNDYNGNDLDNTHIIKDFCKERLELRESISLEYDEDLMSKSDAQMAEVIISKEVGKLNKRFVVRPTIEPGTTYKYSVPNFIKYVTKPMQELLAKIKKADFVVQDSGKIALPDQIKTEVKIGNGIYRLGIGGLHSSEENVCYRASKTHKLIDRDVKSYYPRIITNLGLYPIAMGPNFLKVFQGFIDTRLVAKAQKNFTKDKGLKIFINGMSGKLSDYWSKMYSPDLTIQMTITGQLSLLMFIEMLECNYFEVISANTDGIVIYCERDREEDLNYWVKYWEQLTGFETEDTEYTGYYARDVNAYFAVKIDGSVKVKGPYSEVGSQSGTQLDNNPINLICSDAIKKFLSDGIPVEQTILNCKDITRFVTVRQVKGGAHKNNDYLGKVVRYYYAKGEYGTINYVTNGNKVADTDGAKPILDLPDDFPNDINYQKYLDICRETLYDIGYYQKQKQVSFF